jgi:hypothetical protein
MTKRRIRRQKTEAALAGTFHGGPRTFGFRDVRRDESGHVIQDPGRRDGLRLRGDARPARRAARPGRRTLYGLQHAWNDAGVPSATGKAWSVTALRRLLISQRVAGLRQHGTGDDSRPIIVGEATWPVILDRATWDQVRAVLTDPGRRQPPPSRSYPLRGVLRCAECGKDLVAMPSAGRRMYGCRKESGHGGCGRIFIKADLAERYVESVLLPLLDSPSLRSLVATEAGVEVAEARALVADNAERQCTRAQLADDHYRLHVIDRRTFLRQTEAQQRAIEANQERLSVLRGNSALDRLGGQVQDTWRDLDADDKRSLILSLVGSITVDRHDRAGGNRFNPCRLVFHWRYAALE